MANVQASQTRYVAGVPASSLTLGEESRELTRWIKDELDKVSIAISSLEHQYPPLSEEPNRYSIGFIAYADGANWDPGSGEGLYIYKSSGWSFLG